MAPNGRQFSDQSSWLGSWIWVQAAYHMRAPSPFINILRTKQQMKRIGLTLSRVQPDIAHGYVVHGLYPCVLLLCYMSGSIQSGAVAGWSQQLCPEFADVCFGQQPGVWDGWCQGRGWRAMNAEIDTLVLCPSQAGCLTECPAFSNCQFTDWFLM